LLWRAIRVRSPVVRDKLVANRRSHSLFGTVRFCRNLERAFEKMWDIAHSGKPPRGFDVEERQDR
jgi:predicted O-linked N-acetylglucosamine transferase (SPINDLY family)